MENNINGIELLGKILQTATQKKSSKNKDPFRQGAELAARKAGAKVYEEHAAAVGPQKATEDLMQAQSQDEGLDIQKQALDIVSQQPGILEKLLYPIIGNVRDRMNTTKLENLKTAQTISQGGEFSEDKQTLIAQRKAATALMERQLSDTETDKVYRDPITGQEVSPEQAQQDMEEGLGIYQVNQKLSTRGGVIEKPLNRIPDLTQEEKKYVNDARVLNQSINNLDSGFDSLFDKYSKNVSTWKTFEVENVPFMLAQDPDVQSLKSEIIYLKAAIPFLRGGKQLTPMEAKRIDAMLNPFGKKKEIYKKELERFQDEFMVGAEVMKYGVNAPLMRKLIKTHRKKLSSETENVSTPSSDSGYSSYLRAIGQ